MLKRTLFLLLILPLLLPAPKIQAQEDSPVPTQQMVIEARRLDKRAQVLRDYFARYNSPLEDNAQDFVDAADTYGVDWKLVAAIAGVESTFGKNTPGGFNGWGWGVYGDQAVYFSSWRDGIYSVTKGLRENYLNRGLTTPYSINYAYATSPYWAGKVTYFMSDLDYFARSYNLPEDITPLYQKNNNQVAGSSAQLLNPASII